MQSWGLGLAQESFSQPGLPGLRMQIVRHVNIDSSTPGGTPSSELGAGRVRPGPCGEAGPVGLPYL